MQRYFAPYSEEGNFFTITDEDFHHIKKVMRMKENDKLICVNNEQRAAICSITKISDEQITVDVIEWIDEDAELPVHVTIVNGLPKGDKLEWIIQKCTELGAARFIPFTAARSVVKWDEKKGDKKCARWQKIAKEAAEQSHRNKIPEVVNPTSLQTLVQLAKDYDVKLVAYEEEAKQGETSVLASTLKAMEKGKTLLAVFGPEGGLSPSEIQTLKDNGFTACGLGPRILRTETAPLYLLSAVSYQLELLR
jgi:16S rRNA (uracil1498-N3)-methyltransferase